MSDGTEAAENVRELITEPGEVLYRPVVAAWAPNGVVTPAVFKLNDADKADSNRLSIARGDATTAEGAYTDRAQSIKKRCEDSGKQYRAPVGVLAVTVTEVESIEVKSPEGTEARRPLSAWDDSMNENIPDNHGHIDYNELPPADRGAYEFAVKSLLAHAVRNGWKFGPFA